MDFFERTGKMAIGSRLRILSEIVSKDAASIYELYGINIKPKWFSVFFSLADGDTKGVTVIAKEIGQTHASVSTIAKEMVKAGVVAEVKNDTDRRQTIITLTKHGRELANELVVQCRDVERAVEQISDEATHDLWEALAEWEKILAEKSIFQRVAEIKSLREQSEVLIVGYENKYQEAYFQLNKQWIEKYWTLEPHDIEQMTNPRKQILEQCGHIFVALFENKPVGVVALCKLHDSPYDYELAKLAVDPKIQRKGIGRKLCEYAVDWASKSGAKALFLESNTKLRPAIALYRKLGFKELPEYHPAYARGDIQMELKLQY